MKPLSMFTLTPVLTLLGSLVCGAGERARPSLDRVARERIVAGANQAIHKHFTGGTNAGNEKLIAKEIWGEAISALKPVRVLNDKVNVFIVLKEDATTEEGLYVSIPISSYAPGMDKRFLQFEKISERGDKAFGMLYWCRLAKVQPTAPPKEAPPPK